MQNNSKNLEKKERSVGDSGEARQEFAKRLAQLYSELGLKRKGFADALEWPYSSVRSYDEGRAEPPSLFFKRLKYVFPSVDIGWLVTGEKTIDKLPDALHLRRVPVVHRIPAGGFVEGIPDELVIDHVSTTNLKHHGLFGLVVQGDSMEPEIEEGDFAILAPDMDFVNGAVYAVVANDSEATLKKVFRTQGGWTLIPNNDRYQSLFVPDEKMIRMYKLLEVVRRYNGRKH